MEGTASRGGGGKVGRRRGWGERWGVVRKGGREREEGGVEGRERGGGGHGQKKGGGEMGRGMEGRGEEAKVGGGIGGEREGEGG